MTALWNAMDDFEIPITQAAQIFLNSAWYISSTFSCFAGLGVLFGNFLKNFLLSVLSVSFFFFLIQVIVSRVIAFETPSSVIFAFQLRFETTSYILG